MIQTETHADGLHVIALNRPDKRNAMTPEMFAHLRAAIADVRRGGWGGGAAALVLCGAGRVFCGGFDLRLCLDEPGTLHTLLTELAATITDLRAFDVPVVIAAHGAAIAGGCALLGAADYVVTNDDAKIGYPVVKLGISPAVSAPHLRRMVGDGRCRERLLDTDVVSGGEAVRIGLASESVPRAEEVPGRAMAVARAMMAKPGIGFRETKRWLRSLDEGPAGAGGTTNFHERALAASLSIVGRPEERERLAAMFKQA